MINKNKISYIFTRTERPLLWARPLGLSLSEKSKTNITLNKSLKNQYRSTSTQGGCEFSIVSSYPSTYSNIGGLNNKRKSIKVEATKNTVFKALNNIPLQNNLLLVPSTKEILARKKLAPLFPFSKEKGIPILRKDTNDLSNGQLNNNESYWNQCFDKGRLKNFILWFFLNNGEHKTIKLVEQFKTLGFEYATKAGISLGIEDLKIPPKKALLILEAETITSETVRQYKRGDITGVERFQQLIDTWHRTSEQLKQEVIDNFEATDILNPVYMMAFSGARGNISQVRQLVGMRGLMANPQGQIIDFPIRSNFREGLTLTEYIISSYGARKGIVDTALRTANAGYLTRRLVDVAQHVIISNFDCGTRRGIFLSDMKEGNKTILSLQTRLVGRVCAHDISVNGEKIAKRNNEISLDLAFKISQATKKVFVRSALTCETKKLVCQLCYGWSLAQGNLVAIGEAIGVIAAQSIGEPGTQLTMRTFHTGGVFSGDISDQIRMPFNGYVNYTSPIPGTLIRTPTGKIAFLTKSTGSFIASNREGSQKKKFKIPEYTLLFVRQGEFILEKEVVAQISSISKQKNATDDAELTIKSEIQGQFYIQNLTVKETKVGPKLSQKNLEKEEQFNLVLAEAKHNKTLTNYKSIEENYISPMDSVFSAWDWGNAWILSGKIYQSSQPSLFFAKVGDYINPQSSLLISKGKSSFSNISGLIKLTQSKKNLASKGLLNGLGIKGSAKENLPNYNFEFLSLPLSSLIYKKIGYFGKLTLTPSSNLYNGELPTYKTLLTNNDGIFFIPPNLAKNKLEKTAPVKGNLYPSTWQSTFNVILQWFPLVYKTLSVSNLVVEKISTLQGHNFKLKKKSQKYHKNAHKINLKQKTVSPLISSLSSKIDHNLAFSRILSIPSSTFTLNTFSKNEVKKDIQNINFSRIKKIVDKNKSFFTVNQTKKSKRLLLDYLYNQKNNTSYVGKENEKLVALEGLPSGDDYLSNLKSMGRKINRIKQKASPCRAFKKFITKFKTKPSVESIRPEANKLVNNKIVNNKIELNKLELHKQVTKNPWLYLGQTDSVDCLLKSNSHFLKPGQFIDKDFTFDQYMVSISPTFINSPNNISVITVKNLNLDPKAKGSVFESNNWVINENSRYKLNPSVGSGNTSEKLALKILKVNEHFINSLNTKELLNMKTDLYEISKLNTNPKESLTKINSSLNFKTSKQFKNQLFLNKSLSSSLLLKAFKNPNLIKQQSCLQLLSKYPSFDFSLTPQFNFNGLISSSILNKNHYVLWSYPQGKIKNRNSGCFFSFFVTLPAFKNPNLSKPVSESTNKLTATHLGSTKYSKKSIKTLVPKVLPSAKKLSNTKKHLTYPVKEYQVNFTQPFKFKENNNTNKRSIMTCLNPSSFFQIPNFSSSLTHTLEPSLLSNKKVIKTVMVTKNQVHNYTSSPVGREQANNIKFYGNQFESGFSAIAPFAKTFIFSPFEGEIIQITSPFIDQPGAFKSSNRQNLNTFSKPSSTKTKFTDLITMEPTFLKIKQHTSIIITKEDLKSYYLPKLSNQNITTKDKIYTVKNQFGVIKPTDLALPESATVFDSLLKQNSKFEESKVKLYKLPDITIGFPQTSLTVSKPNFYGTSKLHKLNKKTHKTERNKTKKSTNLLSIHNSQMLSFLLGDFIVSGDSLYSNSYSLPNDLKTAVTDSGQIIHLNKEKVTLRKGQSIFISPKSILHKFDGDFIDPKSPVITLSYQRLKTGDIVQGIPKIEQFFEARTTKRGRLFQDSLPNLVKALFKRYIKKLPLDKAVRQSFYKIQQIIVDGVLRVYRSQGVTIADKHLEIIVKQMTSKVCIIEGGQTGFFPGEIVDLDFIEQVNSTVLNGVEYEPLVLGITKASLEVDSFLSAASFQQTTRVLSSAAIARKKDFLKGLKENVILGNLIPAGTGYLVYLNDFSGK